ncbi:hypothetical protein B0A58_12895 [Flavobacterium branchiophilum NBRC 15030 = ATCC 35035]|nr:hypothetical protein B0A58_12895 [Flavobacterium branchiophilum NBRC 15030 = ATCC 35035]
MFCFKKTSKLRWFHTKILYFCIINSSSNSGNYLRFLDVFIGSTNGLLAGFLSFFLCFLDNFTACFFYIILFKTIYS